MGNKFECDPPAAAPHDARIFLASEAIFCEDDLRGLINNIYSEYRYKRAQSAKLARLINFLALEDNLFLQPELADQKNRLSDYLNSFQDFLNRNFQPERQDENGDTIYFLALEETGFEAEAFLIEFQMLAMDIEKAYRDYRAAANGR